MVGYRRLEVDAVFREAAWTSDSQHYTASQLRKPRLESSPLWKPQISQI